MTSRFLLYCSFFALTLLLFSCGNGESSSDSNKKIFKYNQPNTITSLDPAFAKSQNNIWAIHHLYNGLVELDEGLNVKPSIAKSWETSEDGTTITFQLRDDVFFHDHSGFPEGKGRKVTAQDFVYSFNRILDEKTGSPGAWIFDAVASEEPFSATDDATFVLKLKQPFRPIMGILSMQYCSVVPKEIIEKMGADFRANPVGTGPFKFKNWLEGQAMFLEKNENYFEAGLPKLDGVKISFVGDRKTAFLEFKKGNLDYMSGLESSFADELLTKEGTLQESMATDINFIKIPFLNSEYLGINMTKEDNPLKNKLVRQALNYGFDRDLMLKQLRNSVGKSANSGFTPRGLPSFDNKITGYSYNPELSKALLTQAGHPNGKGLPEIQLMTTKGYVDLCTFIARQWQELGVKVQIESVESATLRNMIKEGKVDFFRGSWIADYPDGESFLVVFNGDKSAPPNYTQFKNKKFDALYEQSLNENDDKKRYELYQEMEKIVIDQSPVIFLFYDETAVFARKNISGISKNALNLLDLKRVDKQ